MQITFNINNERAPTLLAALLIVDPKPTEGEAHYIADETDWQWGRRVLQDRFRKQMIALMNKANRQQPDPDPGISTPW